MIGVYDKLKSDDPQGWEKKVRDLWASWKSIQARQATHNAETLVTIKAEALERGLDLGD